MCVRLWVGVYMWDSTCEGVLLASDVCGLSDSMLDVEYDQ